MCIRLGLCLFGVAISSSAETNVTKEIVVTASFLERDALIVPSSESVGLIAASSEVTSGDIMRQNAGTVTEALQFAPGAWTETRGRKIKQFTSFRGQTYPYPDYAIDGMWFREFYELPYFFPPAELDRIEINRSSSALMTGLSGLSGVINLVPKREDEQVTHLSAEYGTDNLQRYYLSHSEPVTNGTLSVSVSRQSTQGEKDMHSAESMNTVSTRLNVSPVEKLDWDTFLFYLEGRRELQAASSPASNGLKNQVEEFDDMQSLIIGTRLRIYETESATTEWSIWGADRDAKYINHTDRSTHDDDDNEYGVQLLQSVQPMTNNVLRIGGLYHHWVAPDGKRFYAGKRNDIETVSFVMVDEHDFGRLKLDVGYRYSREYWNDYASYNVKGSGAGLGNVDSIEDEWGQPLHRLNMGAQVDLTDGAALYANYSMGQLDADSGAETATGDSAAREVRHMLDFGVALEGDELGLLKVGLFSLQRKDGIRTTAATYINSLGLEVPYYENKDSRQLGFEAEWRSPWYADHTALFASVLLMSSEVESGGSYEKDREIPDQIYTVGVYFRAGHFDANLYSKYIGSYENNRFSAGGVYRPLGEYIDVGCNGGYTFGAKRKARVFGSLTNVLDDHYSTVVGYYDRGLRCSVGLQLTF